MVSIACRVSSDLHLADVAAALFISALMCGTMVPLTLYTGKILLQVTDSCAKQ